MVFTKKLSHIIYHVKRLLLPIPEIAKSGYGLLLMLAPNLLILASGQKLAN